MLQQYPSRPPILSSLLVTSNTNTLSTSSTMYAIRVIVDQLFAICDMTQL